MMKSIALATVLVLGGTFAAGAADLIVDEPAMAASGYAMSGYVKLLGGVTLANTLTSDSDVDYGMGSAFGAAFGVNLPVEGLSLEIDALRTFAEDDGSCPSPGCSLAATTLMANAVFTGDMGAFSLYGGAGVGLVSLDLDLAGIEYTGSGAGFQVFAGAEMPVAENLSLSLEGRYQSAFEDIDVGGGDAEFSRTSVLAGLKLSF